MEKHAVKIAESKTEKEEIYRFRYRIFIEELARHDKNVDLANKMLFDTIDEYSTHIYAVDKEGRITGSLRSTIRSDGRFEADEHFALEKFSGIDRKHLSQSGRLAIDQRFRNTFLLKDLCEAACRLVLEKGVIFDFIYCKPQLIALYERLGDRRYTASFRHPQYGYETPMVISLDDREYLKKIKSPLLKIADSYPTQNREKWFEKTFPEFALIGSSLHLKECNFWQVAADSLVQSQEQKSSLFHEFKAAEIKPLLEKNHIIKAAAGDKIISAGERGSEIFIILEGSVTITLPDSGLVVNMLSEGDTFGEMSLFTGERRSADVVAREDCSLIMFSPKHIDNLIRKQPKIAAKLFYNFSTLLSENLLKANKIIEQLESDRT